MRKRIVICLPVVVVIGVVAFFVSQSKKGSVEWHIRKCRAAHSGVAKGSFSDRALNLWKRVRGQEQSFSFAADHFEEREKHQQQLVMLGYLEQREFVISNRPIDDLMQETGHFLRLDPRWAHFQEEFYSLRRQGANALILIAAPKDMALLADAINKANAPAIEKTR